MSIRHYSPRRNRRNGISFRSKTLLAIVLGITIGSQIIYPLIDGEFLRVVTISTVYWAAGAMALHALLAYGARYAFTYLATTIVFALIVESVGVKTGWPFGTYEYDPSLGHTIAGVPYVVPFAWVMMAHPVLIAARRVAGNWVFLYGGYAMAAWDLFLDPQMVLAQNKTTAYFIKEKIASFKCNNLFQNCYVTDETGTNVRPVALFTSIILMDDR